MNNPYVLSVKAKAYRLRFMSPPLISTSDSLGNTISRRVTEDSGNARANFPNPSEERNLRNISRHSRVLLKRIPGMQGVWRVASIYRLKTTEPPHHRSTLWHTHNKLSAEYRRKRRLCIQNRSAGCLLLCTNTSEQQEVLMFCVQSTTGLPHCDSRPVILAEPAHHDRVESPPRSREIDIQTVGNSSRGHVCHSPQHASSPVHVSSSKSSSTGDRCLVKGLAGEADVHVSTISPAVQSQSEAHDY